jgi:putative (di)nucleoside polyphosphate hydrolase
MTMPPSDYSSERPYRLGVGLMIINKEKKVFVGKRADMATSDLANHWQMPQGGIDSEETPEEAAIREMREEIGTTKVHLLAETPHWLTYEFPESLANVLWGGRFRGQKQKWFLFEYLGQDGEIDIYTPHPEFLAWQWVDPETLPELIVPFKQEMYKQILEMFRPYLK